MSGRSRLACSIALLPSPAVAQGSADAYVEFSGDPAPVALRHHYIAVFGDAVGFEDALVGQPDNDACGLGGDMRSGHDGPGVVDEEARADRALGEGRFTGLCGRHLGAVHAHDPVDGAVQRVGEGRRQARGRNDGAAACQCDGGEEGATGQDKGAYSDIANGAIENSGFQSYTIPAAYFQPGNNVIAVHLLNSSLSMGRLRGNWNEWRGIRVMPTYHPAYLLRSYVALQSRKDLSVQQVTARLWRRRSALRPAVEPLLPEEVVGLGRRRESPNRDYRLARGASAVVVAEGEEPPIEEITPQHIEEVIARMARIPAKQASSTDKDRLKSLEESLGRVVFGQDEAVRTVARAIKRSRAGLGQPDQDRGEPDHAGPAESPGARGTQPHGRRSRTRRRRAISAR